MFFDINGFFICSIQKIIVILHPKGFTLGNVGGIMSAFRPCNNLSRHN